MPVSAFEELRETILRSLRNVSTKGDWKVLIVDGNSKKVLDNVFSQDDILNENIAHVSRIEERRDTDPNMDAVYILSAQPYTVECLVADFETGRYRSANLIWIALLSPTLRRRLENSRGYRRRLARFDTIFTDYFPRESNLITFRDPWSFPILYHPACSGLVAQHLQGLAQKIMGVCVMLDENPKIRFYQPRTPTHQAGILSQQLSTLIQEQLDEYAGFTPKFGDHPGRSQGILVVMDRSADLMAPLLHEFTYQAMAHDVLPIKDSDKVRFRMTINQGQPDQEYKDMELQEDDKVWVDSRHRHMKDAIEKIMGDFQKFLAQNPQFAKKDDSEKASVHAIKDMLAGLPQFQAMKTTYSLHLTMAQSCMDKFQSHKLSDLAAAEQTLATGLDEDARKPKNILDEVVRLLDDTALVPTDRLRLIMIYILFRDGVISDDINRLLAHSSLPPTDSDAVTNLQRLGARMIRGLKETRTPLAPVLPRVPKSISAASAADDDNVLSRYETVLKLLLEELCKGTLDQTVFPYVRQPADVQEDSPAAQGSLRAGRPLWAAAGRRPVENRQRIIIFIAGGATYSESRACYEASLRHGRDVILVTSHMLTAKLFVRQLGDLSTDKRRLDLPVDRPQPKAPDHLYNAAPTPAPASTPVSAFPGPGAVAGRTTGPSVKSRLPGPPKASGVELWPAPALGPQQQAQGEWPSSYSGNAAGGGGPGEPKQDKGKRRHFLGLKK